MPKTFPDNDAKILIVHGIICGTYSQVHEVLQGNSKSRSYSLKEG